MDKKLLGQRIKELRKSKKLKQEQLAEKLGIEPRQLSKLETGRNYPSFETTVALLGVFEISFEELINFAHLKKEEVIKEEISKLLVNLNGENLKIAYKILRAMTI